MKLRAENIQKSYKGRRVVKGVSIEVNQGEIVGLLGPNGAGKTTSFYMIVGLVRPNDGKVFLDEEDITNYAMYQRAQMGIGYLPQEVSVFRKMSIEDNIMSVLEMTKLSKAEREAKLESLIDEFGLSHVRKNLGHSLSGGEKRRTEIARALATDPKFILLDEPFAGVDPIAVEDIQRIVAKLKKRNIGVLITDHNVQETLSITDRTYLLFEGAILRAGTAEQLAADPQVRKVYLGKNFELRKTNILDEEQRKKEKAQFTEEERQGEYVKKVIGIAKNCKYQLNSLRYHNRVDEFQENGSVDLLFQAIENMKTHFVDQQLGKRASEIIKDLRFGPRERYTGGKWSTLIAIMAFVPVIQIPFIFKIRDLNRSFEHDVEDLISHLTTLRFLIENPEMEEML